MYRKEPSLDTAKRIKLIFAIIMIVTGVGIFSYPFVSNALSNRNASTTVDEIQDALDSMDAEEIDAIKKAAEEYNSQLADADEKNDRGEGREISSYVDLVDLGAAIGYLTIPALDLSLPIYEGTDDTVLEHGVGHLSETSYPVGGTSTHSALSGHRGLAEAELFTNLDRLGRGDMFYLHVLDEVLAYKVDRILVVEPDETEALDIIEGEDLCTLVTCTPIGINSHRLLVRGTRVPYTGEETEVAQGLYQNIHTGTAVKRLLVIWPWLALVCVIAVGIEFFLMLTLLKRIRQSREDD